MADLGLHSLLARALGRLLGGPLARLLDRRGVRAGLVTHAAPAGAAPNTITNRSPNCRASSTAVSSAPRAQSEPSTPTTTERGLVRHHTASSGTAATPALAAGRHLRVDDLAPAPEEVLVARRAAR